MEKFDIVGLGLSVIDIVGVGPYYPQEDTKITLSESDWQAGGSTATGLVTGQRMGAGTCFLGQLGLDYFGQKILESLKQEGVDTRFVKVYHDTLSQYSFSYTSQQTGSRTMFINLNKHWNTFFFDAHVRQVVQQARLLMLDRHETKAGIEAVKAANEKGIPSIFDPSSHVTDEIEQLLRLVTYPVLPERFIEKYCHTKDLAEGAREILKLGAKAVVVTSGSEGSILVTADGVEQIPAFKVQVVDSLGAGDVYHGAFAYGILQGWELKNVCVFASAVAALKCEHVGGRKGIPNFYQVKAFLQEQGHDFVD